MLARHPRGPPSLPKPVSEKGGKRQTCWSTTKPCSRKMKALGGNITPMYLWNTSPGEEEWGKSCRCCYGNQILPITGRRCAKVLGSLATAHIISQTPPISYLFALSEDLYSFEALWTEMKGYGDAVVFNKPSWQNIFSSFSEKCQRLSSYYLPLQECARVFTPPLESD